MRILHSRMMPCEWVRGISYGQGVCWLRDILVFNGNASRIWMDCIKIQRMSCCCLVTKHQGVFLKRADVLLETPRRFLKTLWCFHEREIMYKYLLESTFYTEVYRNQGSLVSQTGYWLILSALVWMQPIFSGFTVSQKAPNLWNGETSE